MARITNIECSKYVAKYKNFDGMMGIFKVR
jgi:hypothetical protein